MSKWMDHLLREALDGRAATPSTPCLDADTVAAIADNTLSRAERSRAETHVADCARCQALLAAMVRMTAPPPAPAWWRRPAIAWLVPAAAAVTAIIVWVNMPGSTTVAPSIARAPQVARPAEAEPVPPPLQDQQRQQATAMKERAADTQPRVFADRGVSAPSAAPTPPPAAPTLPPADAEMQAAEPVLPSAPLPQVAAAARPAPEAGAESRPAAPPAAASDALLFGETVTLSTETTNRVLSRRLEGIRNAEIASANRISRWRLGGPGVVHHSTDGGSTWQTFSTGVNVPMTAGASPSLAVCWLVGPGGIVLISTDEGRSWQRLPFPVTVDLVSIDAVDDKTATVTAADGGTFRTSDRGVTWRR